MTDPAGVSVDAAGAGRRSGVKLEGAIRIAGAALVVCYLLGGAIDGLWQQSLRLSDDAINCEYRAQLLKDRWTALAHYPKQTPTDSRFDLSLSSLLDQSARVCAPRAPAVAEELAKLRLHLRNHRRDHRQSPS